MNTKFNATLNINNSNEFGYDIWQNNDSKDWTAAEWKEAVGSMIDTLNEIYDTAGEEIPDTLLYILGDAINLLGSIDITVI